MLYNIYFWFVVMISSGCTLIGFAFVVIAYLNHESVLNRRMPLNQGLRYRLKLTFIWALGTLVESGYVTMLFVLFELNNGTATSIILIANYILAALGCWIFRHHYMICAEVYRNSTRNPYYKALLGHRFY